MRLKWPIAAALSPAARAFSAAERSALAPWTQHAVPRQTVQVCAPAGASLRVYDPEGMTEARKLIKGVEWCRDAYDAAAAADALVIITEWNEFRALDLARLKAAMRRPLIVDLRNIYKPAEMAETGFVYHSIGRSGVIGTA